MDLTVGPPIEEGFYYDCFMGDKTLHPDDLQLIENRMMDALKAKHPLQRIVVSRQEALAMFQENKFKVRSGFGFLCRGMCLRAQIEILNGLDPDATISVYRCGPMVDLCTGPHIPNTDHIKVM